MTLTPPAHARPAWLSGRLVLGGAVMAVLYLLAHGGSMAEALQMLAGLPIGRGEAASLITTLSAIARTTWLLLFALALGLSAATFGTMLAAGFGRTGLHLAALLGRLLAGLPIAAALWIWIGWWISQGGAIETLLPPAPIAWETEWQSILARLFWHEGAALLWLALPAAGLTLSAFADTLATAHHEDLAQGLRGRGLPAAVIRTRHFVPLLWPLWHRRIEGIGIALLVLALPIEAALDYPGWGGKLVAALSAGDASTVSVCLYGSGLILALWTLVTHLIRPRDRRHLGSDQPAALRPREFDRQRTAALDLVHRRRETSSRRWLALIDVTAAIAILATLVYLLRGQSPLQIPTQQWVLDLRQLAAVFLGTLVGGSILTSLRHTFLGNPLRRLGMLETLAWSPLPLWVIAWTHGIGGVVELGQSLTVVGSILLAVELHACTRRALNRDYLQASRVLGASPLRAWWTHALGSWIQDLIGTLCWLGAGLWSLLFLSEALVAHSQADPEASLGQRIAAFSQESLLTRQELLGSGVLALLSILFLWILSRIILPSDDF